MLNKCGSCKWDYHCRRWERDNGQGCEDYVEDKNLTKEEKDKYEKPIDYNPFF
jgi:hypothetical protein